MFMWVASLGAKSDARMQDKEQRIEENSEAIAKNAKCERQDELISPLR